VRAAAQPRERERAVQGRAPFAFSDTAGGSVEAFGYGPIDNFFRILYHD